MNESKRKHRNKNKQNIFIFKTSQSHSTLIQAADISTSNVNDFGILDFYH